MRSPMTLPFLYSYNTKTAQTSLSGYHAGAAKSRCFASGVQARRSLRRIHPQCSCLSRFDTNRHAPRRTPLGHLQHRPLTTQRKEFLKRQLKVSGKFLIYSWLIGGGILFTIYVVNEDRLERFYPSPSGWTFFSRSAYRNAKTREEPEAFANEVVDWVLTGNMYKNLVRRLEDPNIDGAGLKEQDAGGVLIEGVGKMGYDIEDKPEPWRRGYYEALMGAAKGAENLDGFVTDTTRGIVFPPDVVVGPSNPNPRPCPPNAAKAPLEENCRLAFESPEVFYMRILTTKGFTTRQRLLAALAYADWLDFKHLTGTAREMFNWALDIAMSPLERPEAVLDKATGVIKPDAPVVTSNVLLAATSLGTYYARNSDIPSALPILVSVLRARRSLPPPSAPSPSQQIQSKDTDQPDGIMAYIKSMIHTAVYRPPFPPAPPSGDEQASRTATSICEEAGLMANIGEIMYAYSTPTDGLSWTREAVEVAEKQYQSSEGDDEASEKCKECLDVALENWLTMVSTLAAKRKEQEESSTADQEEAVADKTQTPAPTHDARKETGKSWSWWPSHARKTPTASAGIADVDWEKEEELVENRAKTIRRMLELRSFKEKKGGAAWFGTMLFN